MEARAKQAFVFAKLTLSYYYCSAYHTMKTTVIFILALGVAATLHSQQFQIDAFSRNGVLTFSDAANQGETYTVQWSPDLTSNSWQSAWDALVTVPVGSNHSATVQVPMFYRVVQETIDLGEYYYPFGFTPLTFLAKLDSNLTFEEKRVALTNIPVYAVYATPPRTNFLGYANKHYSRYTYNNEIWHEYFGMDSNHIHFFGVDEVGEELRVDPGLQLPRRVKVGKDYMGSSQVILNGSPAGTASWAFKVVRRTRMIVFGGDFDDVIELEETFVWVDGSSNKRRAFYARGIGMVKRIEVGGRGRHRELFEIEQQ